MWEEEGRGGGVKEGGLGIRGYTGGKEGRWGEG